ncbi:tRNA epoxyqueuosine(34) reductase QueG [Thalassolituus sp. LLYu03]|uniref:tRNA epoxyqueuosine(34) reductase QueG n=1 Tax=Thalassolituus sp. LLYu03 TaxID=3421656 RepID=UPI003D2D33E3
MSEHSAAISAQRLAQLRSQLSEWAAELGFQQVGVTGTDLGEHEQRLQQWLANGYQGGMSYMADHGNMRSRPQELLPGTLRVISLRMDYLAPDVSITEQLQDKSQAYISRYALGRDYHKLIRKRLTELGKRLQQAAGEMGFRAFVDSAPVLERALANKAGLGWIGKNTMLINRKAGSYFFLGEILTDLPLPLDDAYEQDHCGRCTSCLDICPTQAFVGEHVLDARRCISYLTIELNGPIPPDLREGIGNRIFGCDDCQIGCPWNRFSKASAEPDFSPRANLDKASLLELFAWDEATFLKHTEGMPIRRTGYENWLRNIAVALGNAPQSLDVVDALNNRREQVSALVQEHIDWALAQQTKKQK